MYAGEVVGAVGVGGWVSVEEEGDEGPAMLAGSASERRLVQ